MNDIETPQHHGYKHQLETAYSSGVILLVCYLCRDCESGKVVDYWQRAWEKIGPEEQPRCRLCHAEYLTESVQRIA